jgi:phospholipid/cholesterol/gamma-HCH transport system ATP-binding protein
MKIEFKNVSKAYGSKIIFTDLSLVINSGERCVLLGGSGTGKSQLLKHIVGLVKPDKGRVLVDDVDITDFDEHALEPVRKKIGYIFQSGGILESMTVGENVGLPLRELTKTPEKEVQAKVLEVLKIVGLEGVQSQMPSTISGGQRKRVAIARSLTQDVDCFLFDEPTAGLDPMTSCTVDDVVLQVNEELKATVLVVTHDLISMSELGQRVLFLHDHKIAFDGTVPDFYASKEQPIKDFLSRDQRAIHPPAIKSARNESRESVEVKK